MRRCTVTLNLTVHAWGLYAVGCLLSLKTLFDMSIIIILFACSVICDVMYMHNYTFYAEVAGQIML